MEHSNLEIEGKKQKFLHGTLEATIFHATPYTPPFPLNCVLPNGKPAYVTIKIDKTKVAKTGARSDRLWNHSFQILCAHPRSSLITITLKTSCSILGILKLEAHEIISEASLVNGFFALSTENGKPVSPEVRLRLLLWFKPAEQEPSWEEVIRGGQFLGLKNASFPLRSNNRVALYQDAHHCSDFQPPFDLCGTPGRLWEDVYRAIEEAKYLVYIAGWSLNPNIVLVRDPKTEIPHAKGVPLGELLKRKAEEGVAVRVMLWDDETSLPFIRNAGVMRTHDEDALAYFKHSKVVCRLCPRLHDKFPTLFSHHQKTLTLDVGSGSSLGREIASFLGGLDLCDGRYDTDQHSLFRTLNESHSSDFYQTSVAGASLQKGGPREPWHDSHARITGPAAWDVLTNFEQRWTRQVDASLLVPASTLMKLVTDGTNPNSIISDNCCDDWNVQVFRSIDALSTSQLFQETTVERSVHDGYVEAIRKAERFIYIENQYFIGGSHLWQTDRSSGCCNLIPVEIALKVAAKIKARQRFEVYIVTPLWPEGEPESESVHDILHWTRETVAMMYRIIGEAIEDAGRGREIEPRDYLNFFCLGNRECVGKGEFVPPESPRHGTHYWSSQTHRRFMVYVHSKLMIVDDAYLLIGSANINQRSMDGERDTEIAVGCYQPHQAGNKNDTHSTNACRNDIRAFRMSLWFEHTRLSDESFINPETLECATKLRSVGERMWNIYEGEEVLDMEGVHLMTYPINVTEDGRVEDLHGANFPDTNTPIQGKRSKILPPIFTT